MDLAATNEGRITAGGARRTGRRRQACRLRFLTRHPHPDSPSRPTWLALVLALVAGASSGCGSGDNVPPLFAAAEIPVTVTEFRIRLNDFSEYFVASIDEASETVIDAAEDQAVRRSAMEFRLRTVNRFLNSLNQPDPVASLVDAWAFCLQLEAYVGPGGAGAELFGDQQPVIVAATTAASREVARVVDAVTRPSGTSAEAVNMVHGWAAENPLTSEMMVRRSTVVLLAEQLEARSNSPFEALGRLQAGVDDIVAQYQRYVSVMPRTVRWHSQLILHETLYDELDIGATMEAVDLAAEYLLELRVLADEMIAELPGREELEAELMAALASLEPIIEAERARLQAEIDRQRLLIFEDVDVQRAAIMADVEAQIALVDEQIQGRLEEVFERIETLTDATLEQSFRESERLVDLVYLRVLTLLLVALAGGAGLMILRNRLGAS